MNLAEKIRQLTLDGLSISFEENRLGIAATGERVINIEIHKNGRNIGTGIPYDNFSESSSAEAIDRLYEIYLREQSH